MDHHKELAKGLVEGQIDNIEVCQTRDTREIFVSIKNTIVDCLMSDRSTYKYNAQPFSCPCRNEPHDSGSLPFRRKICYPFHRPFQIPSIPVTKRKRLVLARPFVRIKRALFQRSISALLWYPR
jgi:hypothetical protein